MTPEVAKISPAFEPFLADSGNTDQREAIVIFRAPEAPAHTPRGRMRALKQRLDLVKESANAQLRQLSEDYGKLAGKTPSSKASEPASIGKSALPIASVEVTRKSLPIIAERPDVLAILPNQRIHLIKPKKTEYVALKKQEQKDGLTWGLKQLGIPEMWKTTKGKDITVAVMDTGVHGDHPALSVKHFVVVDPLGRRIEAKPSFDSGSHGTHVCGTIAGRKNPEGVTIGIAPEATLAVAGVLVGDATLRSLLEGISWAVEKGADIINMSLGFSYYEPLFEQVFEMLIQQYGVLPVVAVGNENHGNTSSPGNARSALSVGAAEIATGAKLDVAFFSSGASLVFPGEEEKALIVKPDVVAPGANVYSSVPPQKTASGIYEYSYMDGTSMATPHVAGIAALLMSAEPNASPLRIMQALRETAKHPQGTERRPDNRWGYGIVQPIEALKALK